MTKLFEAGADALHVAPQSEFAAGTIVKQARELGYRGPIYGETITVGTTALQIAGDAATGLKAITATADPDNEKAQEVLANFRERYDYVTLPWHLGSAYDDVYIAAECLKQIDDDQDADGFRDCLYGITWSGAIGDNYSFDEQWRGRRSVKGGRGGSPAGREDGGELRFQGPERRLSRVDTAGRSVLSGTRSAGRLQGRRERSPVGSRHHLPALSDRQASVELQASLDLRD